MNSKLILGLVFSFLFLFSFAIADELPICIDLKLPDAPTGFDFSNGVLSWKAVSDSPSCSGIDFYEISKNGELIGNVDSNSLAIGDVTGAYSVLAVDLGGNRGPLATFTVSSSSGSSSSSSSGSSSGGSSSGGGGFVSASVAVDALDDDSDDDSIPTDDEIENNEAPVFKTLEDNDDATNELVDDSSLKEKDSKSNEIQRPIQGAFIGGGTIDLIPIILLGVFLLGLLAILIYRKYRR